MHRWTQIEYDEVKRLPEGHVLGTGDFRAVDFRGKHNVIIGEGSILGDDVHLGVSCEIGHHSLIGARFRDEGNLRVGKYCRFGESAHIDEMGIIERGASFASGVELCENVELGEDVELPKVCRYLFDRRAKSADGWSLIRLSPVAGRTICAFTAEYEDRKSVLVTQRGLLCTLEEYIQRTKELLSLAQAGSPKNLLDAQDMHAAGMYIRDHFARRQTA